MAVDGNVSRAGIVRRGFNQADAAPLRQILWSDVSPVLSAVARQLNQSVIGACPDQAARKRRLRDAEHGVVILGASIVDRDGATRGLLLAFVVAGEVGTDRFPMHASIGGLEDTFAPVIDSVGVMGRNDQRRSPLKTVLEIRGAIGVGQIRLHSNVLKLPSALVEAG